MIDFNRQDFFPIKKEATKDSIEELLKDIILDKKNLTNIIISNICSLKNIFNKSILFINKNNEKFIINNNSVLTITDSHNRFSNIIDDPCILVSNLGKSYNLLANEIFFHEDNNNFNDEFKFINNSYFSKYSHIHPSSKFGNNCVIGRGVKIGSNCIIKNNVIIKNAILGKSVNVSDSTTIGSTGFGFDINNMGSNDISPHLGIVYIGDYVHLGSNCTIDRGKIDVTYIGRKSMLDNMVHIAHNVVIGDNACIAAQSGVSGSTEIGKNFIAGGQSGIAGHLKIGDNVVVAAKSGVTKNIKKNSIVAGFPAIDIKEWKKNIIRNRKYK